MVAIVAGNSLGLSLTSLATLGQTGTNGSSVTGRSGEQVFVNAENGNLVIQDQDDYVAARGLDLSALRTYNSEGKIVGGVPTNWGVGAANQRMVLVSTWGAANGLVRTDRDGAEATYTWVTDHYVAMVGSGAFDTVTRDTANSQYVWTDGTTGLVERFNYSGKLVTATDTDGNVVSYAYDAQGRLSTATGANGEVLQYEYSAAGDLSDITTLLPGGIAKRRVYYEYDTNATGHRLITVTVDLSPADNAYMDGVSYTTSYTYEGTSQRLSTITQKDGSSLTFTYDAQQRVATVKDALGHVTTFTYDEAGRVKTMTDAVGQSELYEYDGVGNKTKFTNKRNAVWTYAYDVAGRVTQSGSSGLPREYLQALYGKDANGNPLAGNGSQKRSTYYNANGQMVVQQISGIGTLAHTINNQAWDGAGNLTDYKVTNADGSSSSYNTVLTQFDGYKELLVSGTSSILRPGTTNSHYDVNGFLTSVDEPNTPADDRTFINDLNGQVLAVQQGTHLLRELIVNGEVLAQYGSGVDQTTPRDTSGQPIFDNNIANFQLGYRSITPTYPAASPGLYTVQNGDTLRSIAQSAYGDSALWFQLAQANGMDSDSDLRMGMSLTVPNLIGSHNGANVFTPYDPSKVVGDTTPYLAPPQADGGACGGMGQVIMLAVAVVVAAYAGPMAFNALVGETTYTAGALVDGVMTLTSVTPGLSAAAAQVASSALAAVAGSVASQAVGNVLGVQHGFDWRQVGLSALSAGIGTGLGQLAEEAGFFSEIGLAGRTALGNAATQGIGIVTGLQHRFDWRGVVGSAVGARVGQSIGSELGLDDPTFKNRPFGEQFGPRLVTGLAAGAAAAVAHGGRIAVQQVATDAFGNALGSSIADNMSGSGNPASAYGYENEMDRASDNYSPSLQNTAQQSFRLGEITEQNTRARADALYGWNTGSDGLGFKPVTGLGTVGMRYDGVRSSMADATRVVSDSNDPYTPVNVGQDGSPTAFLGLGVLGQQAAGAGVASGYEATRPRGAGALPPYDFVRDMPSGAPGSSQANPSLGLGAPPKQADDRSWLDFINPGIPLPIKVMGLLDNLIFKSPSQKLGEALQGAGYQRPADTAPHHIVPEGDARAADIRQRLKEWDIGINAADNGVFLPQKPGSEAPGAYHPRLNNNEYYDQLREDFRGVNTRQRALDTLKDIRGQLLNGTYPGSRPVPPKQ